MRSLRNENVLYLYRVAIKIKAFHISPMFRFLFLPVALIMALIGGILFREGGVIVSAWSVAGLSSQSLLIIMVFFFSGYLIKRRDMRFEGNVWLIILVSSVINLVLGPVLAFLFTSAVEWPMGIELGMLAITCAPTTLSSAVVITRSAGGNATLAVALTVVLTVTGALVMPLTLGCVIGMTGLPPIPVGVLLVKMIKLVLLPIGLGMLTRRLTRAWEHPFLGYFGSFGIVPVVWMNVCENSELLTGLRMGRLLGIIGGSLLIHLLLAMVAKFAGQRLKLAKNEALAMVFVASQKTLPLTIALISSISMGEASNGIRGEAAVVCVLFHLSQIVCDSFLASWWGGKR